MEQNLKILLVEDNPGDAFLVKFYLEESIFKEAQFIHAEYMKSALDILSKNKIDVVLLDLNLPDSKGLETVEQILAQTTDSVVIVLTGLADNELGVQTVKLGAQDFLVKGQFDGKVLTSSIRYAFERAQLKKRVRELDERIIQYNAVQEIAQIGYWSIDLQTKKLKLTAFSKKLLGIESEQGTGFDNFTSVLDDSSHESFNNSLVEAFETGIDFSLRIKLLANNSDFLMKSKYQKEENIISGTLQKL